MSRSAQLLYLLALLQMASWDRAGAEDAAGGSTSPEHVLGSQLDADRCLSTAQRVRWTGVFGDPYLLHEDCVGAVALTDDGRIAYTVSADGAVTAWQGGTRKRRWHMDICQKWSRTNVLGAVGGGIAVFVATEGETVAIAMAESRVLWSVSTDSAVDAVTVSPSGSRVAMRFETTVVLSRIGDADPFDSSQSLQGCYSALAFVDDGHLMAATTRAQLVLLNADDGRVLRETAPLGGKICEIAVAKGGAVAIAGTVEGDVHVVKIPSLQLRRALRPRDGELTALAIEPSGGQGLAGYLDGELLLFSLETAAPTMPLARHASMVACVAFALDGRHCISGSVEGVARVDKILGEGAPPGGSAAAGYAMAVWADPTSGSIGLVTDRGYVAAWKSNSATPRVLAPGADEKLEGAAYCRASQRLLIAGKGLRAIHLRDALARAEPLAGALPESTTSLAAVGDGRHVIAGSSAGDLTLLPLDEGAEARTWRAHSDAVMAIATHPGGAVVVTAGKDKAVLIWETKTWARRELDERREEKVRWLGLSPSGHRLATASQEGFVRVWDVESLDMVASFRPENPDISVESLIPVAVAFSPDGERVAVLDSGGGLNVIRASTGALEDWMRVGMDATVLEWSAHGILVGCANGVVKQYTWQSVMNRVTRPR